MFLFWTPNCRRKYRRIIAVNSSSPNNVGRIYLHTRQCRARNWSIVSSDGTKRLTQNITCPVSFGVHHVRQIGAPSIVRDLGVLHYPPPMSEDGVADCSVDGSSGASSVILYHDALLEKCRSGIHSLLADILLSVRPSRLSAGGAVSTEH